LEPSGRRRIGAQLVAQIVPLDVENRGARPGVETADAEPVPIAAEQAGVTEAERVGSPRAARGEEPDLRHVVERLHPVRERLLRAPGFRTVQVKDDDDVTEFVDSHETDRPLRVDLDDRLGEGVEVVARRYRRVVRPPRPVHHPDRRHAKTSALVRHYSS